MTAIRTILHPTDFSPHSEYAFRLACSLARDYGARIVLLHVQAPVPLTFGDLGPLPEDPGLIAQALRAELHRLQPADPAIPVEHRLLVGNAAQEILETARQVAADLIVMGTHGRSGLGRLLMGSVAEAVLRKAPCPVLTVKNPQPATTQAAAEEAGGAIAEGGQAQTSGMPSG